MLLELHILQNFAPANLNRDDTNAPKDCEFGGYRRARISSQCLKRAIRTEFERSHLLANEHLSKRTKTLMDRVTERLVNAQRAETEVRPVVELAINSLGLGLKDGKTQYLLFLSEAAIDGFAKLLDQQWTDLAAAVPAADPSAGKKETKKKTKAAAPSSLAGAADTLLNGERAADLALFGRMLADLPARNVDGACQVAHAISTNKVEMEFDFYTAIDDFAPNDNQGAAMMGTVEFNSSCFYRYANLDYTQLLRNLGNDSALAMQTLEAFVRGSLLAIPSGKQNSMAARNPPSFALAVVRDGGAWSLANAFLQPVRPKGELSLVARSMVQLDAYWGSLAGVYGTQGIRAISWLAVDEVELPALHAGRVQPAQRESQVDALVARIRSTLQGTPAGVTA
jgi:CRISPR system Cascade subunit CasC